MGFLRVILALSVLLSHAGGIQLHIFDQIFIYTITGGVIAVQCFYIISGFYMALILSDKYATDKGGLYLFYTNRIWRLMPVYLFFLFVAFCVSLICAKTHLSPKPPVSYLIMHFNEFDFTALFFLIFTNIFIIGHELVCTFLFVNPSDGSTFFSLDIMQSYGLGVFYLIPQSWSLSIEFYFYLIVPFVIKKTPLMIGLIILSFMTRIFLYSMGYDYRIWETGFFPNDIALFLLGSISYKIYNQLNSNKIFNKLNISIISILVFSLTFCYDLLPQWKTFKYFLSNAQIIYYSAIVIGLPFVFQMSRKSRIDRFIGELSYPIYLSHLIIIGIWKFFLKTEGSLGALLLISLTTIIVSLVVVLLIQKPVDKYRQNRLLAKNNDKKDQQNNLINRWFGSLPKSKA